MEKLVQNIYTRICSYSLYQIIFIHFLTQSRDAPAKASPDVQESLEQALHDFEETLIRSSTSDARSPIMSPLLNNHFSSSLSIRSDSKSGKEIGFDIGFSSQRQ